MRSRAFVGAALKQPVTAKIFPDQEALALAVSRNDVDVAVVGPLAYLRVEKKAGVRLLFRTVRQGKSTYQSVLFAGPTSTWASLEQLKKEKRPLKVAWVETSSATGYLLPKATLINAGITPAQSFETQDFLGSHDAVCKAVLEGKYDLGATFHDPAPNAPRVTGCIKVLGPRADTLKVVAMSTEVPTDVMITSPTFSKDKGDTLIAAAKSPAWSKAIKAALLAEGTAPVTDADFDPVREALDTLVP